MTRDEEIEFAIRLLVEVVLGYTTVVDVAGNSPREGQSTIRIRPVALHTARPPNHECLERAADLIMARAAAAEKAITK